MARNKGEVMHMDYEPTGRPVGSTLSDTTINTTETKIFSYRAPFRIRLTELAVFGDANLVTNGRIKIVVGGEVITGTQTSPGSIKLNSAVQGMTKDWKNSQVYLERSAEIEVWAYVTTGTATIAVDMTGEQVKE